MPVSRHVFRQITISNFREITERYTGSVGMSIGGGSAGPPRVVEYEGRNQVLAPTSVNVTFNRGDTGEMLLQLTLSADVMYDFDEAEREEGIARVRRENTLPKEVQEETMQRLVVMAFSSIVRLSQDFRIMPPILIPGVTAPEEEPQG